MKKLTLLSVMAMLCLFSSAGLRAQSTLPNIAPLQLGSKVPDSFWQVNHTVLTNGKVTKQTLGAYKGRLLIIDFWATWCSPCVAMIPATEHLQKQFAGKVQFIAATYQTADVILSFLQRLEKQSRQNFSVPQLTDSKVLHSLFPHRYIPHYVWIDTYGIVKAITGPDEINSTNIEKALAKGLFPPATKIDEVLPVNVNLPLLSQQNTSVNKDIQLACILSGYIAGLEGSQQLFAPDSLKRYRLLAQNQSLLNLFKKAYANYGITNRQQIIIDIKEDEELINIKHEDPKVWIAKHGYTFDFIAGPPYAHNQTEFFTLMQKQLALCFPAYSASVIQKKVKYLALERTSTVDKLKSNGGAPSFNNSSQGYVITNYPLSAFVHMLNILHMQKSEKILMDKTGYHGRVNLNLVANMSNISEINTALAKYDLTFIEREEEIAFLQISKRNTP